MCRPTVSGSPRRPFLAHPDDRSWLAHTTASGSPRRPLSGSPRRPFLARPDAVSGSPRPAQTLRSHRPCRCFLRVALSRSKPETRADRDPKGALGLAFGTLWAPCGWLLGANLGVKTASKRREISISKSIAKIIENGALGAPKSGQFLSRKNGGPELVFQ